MKKFVAFVLAAALCAPAFAQKMGSTNANAPTVKQSIAIGENKMSLDYTSITWADGKTMARIMDKDAGAGMRKRMSENAANAPLGAFNSSVDVMVGETHLPAGDYKVFFTIDDSLAWSINFMGKDGKTHQVKLQLEDSQHESKRLMLCLYAEENGAGAYIAFGNKSGMLSFQPHDSK